MNLLLAFILSGPWTRVEGDKSRVQNENNYVRLTANVNFNMTTERIRYTSAGNTIGQDHDKINCLFSERENK